MNYKKLLPIIGNSFNEPPLYFPLSEESEYYSLFADVPQHEIQNLMERIMFQSGTRWSVSGYLENRATILRNYPQMVIEGRFYHLGIDINVPCGTKLFAPYDCEVVVSDYEEGQGNYGGLTVLKCGIQSAGMVYLLFGHLNPEKLPCVGARLAQGMEFAQIGDMTQNGNWFYHTHLQVLTQKAFDEGWVSKGYCRESELVFIDEYCPNPLDVLGVS